MKGLFTNSQVKNLHVMSKADKKKLNQSIPNAFDMKQEFKVYHLANKIDLFKSESSWAYFLFDGTLYPTLKNFDKNSFNCVVLDEGAYAPIMRGADVLIPGVLRFEEQNKNIKGQEVVGIEIADKGVCAVGKTMMSFAEMKEKKEGAGIEVYHVLGDDLDLNKIK